MPPYYISTPIYYVNDAPHLGHAYTTILADTLARFHACLDHKDNTFFLTGTDEHGQKIQQAAAQQNVTPQALADSVVTRFQDTWAKLGIRNDDFIRTTQERHKAVAADFWRRLVAAGDIYLDKYNGWYCVACEAFYPQSQLAPGDLCPTHKTAAQWISEPSYFFRMSKYQDALLAHIEANPNFIRPESYRNEILSFVRNGLRDLSVSRNSFSWGIPVPDDTKHVIYVWIDALVNYISALGGIGTPQYDEYWPANCHLIGKDILRFHAVYWPCILLAAGLPLPQTILTHGWWTVRGEKISKSLPATRVDPNQLAEDIGADSLRYFLLREVPLGLDGDFSYESLIARYNADLANDLGNLVSRVIAMANKYCSGSVPPRCDDQAEIHTALTQTVMQCAQKASEDFLEYRPSRALEHIWRAISETNRYVDSTKPWSLAKDSSNQPELFQTMRTALEALNAIAQMIAPIMPTKATALLVQLGFSDQQANVHRWPGAPQSLDLKQQAKLRPGPPLFPRIDDKRKTELLDRWIPADAKTPARAPAPSRPQINFDEFAKIDFRVGQITAAEKIPKTSKLLKVQIDIGAPKPRQVVAGIAEAYSPAELVGRKVIFVANLKPAKIRGVQSEGMILAAGDQSILGLSTIDTDVPVGTSVR